jgi:hypothetical protein
MVKAAPIKFSFSGGEYTPLMEGRVDQPAYPTACSRIRNGIPTVQGPLIRRGGFYFVSEVKDSSKRSWLWKFQFNVNQAYILEFGHQYIRFYTSHAQVLSGMSAYELVSPYSESDLVDSDGCFRLKFEQSRDVIYIAHSAYKTRKLTRLANTNWTLTSMANAGGPFQDTNTDTAKSVYVKGQSTAISAAANNGSGLIRLTVTSSTGFTSGDKATVVGVSAISGDFTITVINGTTIDLQGTTFAANTVSSASIYTSLNEGSTVQLVANSGIFESGLVGSLFYLEQLFANAVRPWEAGKTIANGALRRSDSKTYEAIVGGTSGSSKPVHTSGNAYDGSDSSSVLWRYADAGYGWIEITGYIDAQNVTGTVKAALPKECLGSTGASRRWAKAAWSAVDGYPDQVKIFRERLAFTDGEYADLSVSNDFENFARKDFGQVTAQMAVRAQIPGSQINTSKWMAAGNDLLIGTAGAEYLMSTITSSEPFGPDNARISLQTGYGGRGVPALTIGEPTLFAQRSGRKLRDIAYTFEKDKYAGRDTTIFSEHLLRNGIVDMDYQAEPHSLIWGVTNDGKLIGFTYNTEQNVLSWHPHPIGGGGIVESVRCIPSPDTNRDELWAIVRFTINGQTKRYIGYMKPEYDASTMRQDDMFHVDFGLSLYNAVNATLSAGASAMTKGATGVTFTAGSSVFSSGDVGRLIHYDYTETIEDDTGDFVTVKKKAVALITGYTSGTVVTCTINKPFPSAPSLAANAWRMTVTTLSGLSHLEGRTVAILVDGAAHPDAVVTSGAVSLNYPASVVHVGLPTTFYVRSMRNEAGAVNGTAQGKTKRTNKAIFRFKDTLGGSIGARDSLLDPINFRMPSDPLDEATPLFSGDKTVTMPEGYDTDGYVIYKNSQPLAATIICWMPDVETQDRQ